MSISVSVTNPVSSEMTPAKFLLDVDGSDGAAELDWGIEEAIRSRHAASTRRTYDYWMGRLRRWMEEPEERFRLTHKPAIPFRTLWPIGRDSEQIIRFWLTDLNLGPAEPAEFEEWIETTGPLAPGTLDMVIAAIRARSSDFQDTRWEPSTKMSNTLAGIRRRLREHYGANRQAEPLLAAHVATIAAHLHGIDSPDAARDRLLLELHHVRVDGGGASRLRLDSLRTTRAGIVTVSGDANALPYAEAGPVAATALIVPGQNRRGGNSDRDVVLTLSEHPALASALERYLRWRRTHDSGDELIVLGPNRSHHIRKTLGRLAEIAEVEWRPARGAWATPGEVRVMRSVLDAGVDWSGQVRRRRDHVMLVVGYLCALRRSELCALRIRDIRIEPQRAIITIAKSKKDQEQRGARLAIARVEDSAAHLDAVTILADWIALLREHGAGPDAPLFPSLNRHGDVLRRRTDTAGYTAIDGQSWSERLCELATAARVFGDDDTGRYGNVTGHSLRRGFVTSAILAGYDAVTIAKQTRHKNVQMIATYADSLRILEGTDWAGALFGSATTAGLEVLTVLDAA